MSLRYLDIDAFPDTTPVQVQINTVAPALGPEEVEQRITFPDRAGHRRPAGPGADAFDLEVRPVAGRRHLRGRHRHLLRPPAGQRAAGDRRAGRRHRAAEDGAGRHRAWARCFTTSSPAQGNDVTELRTIHDWVIKPKMRTVQGAAEINTWGGYEKQYQVRIDPDLLIKYGLTFDEVVRAVEENNRNVGGGNVREGTQSVLVQGVGRTTNVEQIKGIVITAKDGVPIRVGDVAEVAIGSEIRRGAVTADGKGEVVLGLGFMLMGENTHEVTWAMKDRLDEIKATLPPNVSVDAGLRPHRAGRSRHRHGQEQPVRRRPARHRRPVRVPRQPAGGADRGAGDSAVDAVRLLPACCGSASRPAC